MDNKELEVASEILPFFEKDINSKPSINEKNVVSKFSFILPDSVTEVGKLNKDDDGDYILKRKDKKDTKDGLIFLEHSVSTELRLVGLQIWRAALLLADFVIHFRNSFESKIVLELGSGVGLTSVVAGMFAKRVICTDIDVGDILPLIRSNVERNRRILKAEMSVLGLSFFDGEFSPVVAKELEDVAVVLAADGELDLFLVVEVIYDNDVTEAFVETIGKILSIKPKKELYIAMEKRYVFTISELDSVAPCYEHFMSCLTSARSKPPFSEWTLSQVPLDFPQYFNYERVRQLVMYKITS